MIQLETLSGKIYQNIYLQETDTKYKHIIKYIKNPISRSKKCSLFKVYSKPDRRNMQIRCPSKWILFKVCESPN